MDDQMGLWDDRQPVTMVAVCAWCGEALAAIPVADAADPWWEAVCWGYIAQTQHEAAGCEARNAPLQEATGATRGSQGSRHPTHPPGGPGALRGSQDVQDGG